MSVPKRIKDLANKVRNEIYGKDVRESIAQSMEVTGETAEEAKERSLEQTDRVDTLIRENPQPSEVVDARGNFDILRDRLNSSDQQLAQTETKLNLEGWELQSKTRGVKPLVTFIDDDGRIDVLTKLKILSERYGIPFTVAAFVRAIEDEGMAQYMSKEDLLHLQNDLGWEISSHTYNHLNLSTLTDEEQEYEMKHSKEVLESWGLDVTTLCYPYDGRNDKTYELAKKYYRSARRTGGVINTVPLETFEIKSTTLGSWFEVNGNTLEHYKSRVDRAIEENGWVIFMTHCADPDHDETQQQYLEETIQYIQSKDIEIVTYDEGLNRMGNIIDIGYYGESNPNKKHFVVGADGSVHGQDAQDRVKVTGVNEYGINSKPSEFKFGYTHQTRITTSVAEADSFPEQRAGNLKTVALDSYTAELSYTFQEYRPIGTQNVYIRSALSNDSWSEWEIINSAAIYTPPNTFTSTSKPSDFKQRKVTYTQVTQNTSDFPGGVSGVLITSRISVNSDVFNFQEYHPNGSNKVFKRVGTSDNSWGDWSDISGYISELEYNSVSSDTLAEAFPVNKISYTRITLSNSSGFPNNAAGVLTTNCIYNLKGYRWQEYDVFNTHLRFKRYEGSDGTWSEWKELSSN